MGAICTRAIAAGAGIDVWARISTRLIHELARIAVIVICRTRIGIWVGAIGLIRRLVRIWIGVWIRIWASIICT